ncbi:MAG: TolC family protein [Spirochaetales bacterium]|nr:TolC family protein [Spirochaetales bacterium]
MKKYVCLLLLLIFFLFSCFGETVLTVDSAVQMALENNRSLKRQEISFMDKERTAKNRWNVFLPDITASAGISRGNEILKNSPEAKWGGRVSGAISITLGTDIPHKMNRIKEEYAAGNIDYEVAQRNLEVTVRQGFYELLFVKKDMELVQSNLETNKKRYDQAEARYKGGLAPELDVLNSWLAWSKLVPTYDTLTTNYERKLDQLKITLGIPAGEEVVLQGDVEAMIPKEFDLSSIPEEYETPELRKLKASLNVAESSRKELRGSSLMPEISLGWSITPTWDDLSQSDQYVDRGSLSATIMWHLDNLIPNSSGNLKIKQLEDNAAKIRLQIAEEEEDSISRVENLVRQIKNQQASVKTLEMTRDVAEKTLSLTEEAYNFGTKDMLDVSDAQQTVRNAELDILAKKFDIYCSLLELEYTLNLTFGTLGR